MTEGQVLDIARQALYTIILCSAPLLIISLVVGLVVSIFQTVTSIQEQTLTFIPKIIAVFVGMILCGSWMLNQLSDFMVKLWNDFGIYIDPVAQLHPYRHLGMMHVYFPIRKYFQYSGSNLGRDFKTVQRIFFIRSAPFHLERDWSRTLSIGFFQIFHRMVAD